MTRVIGLTGGIGCGKTEVARLLGELGAVIIDADRIGREVIEQEPKVRSELRRIFGDRFFDSNDRLRRAELGHHIFSDDTRKRQLNEVMHPRLLERLRIAVQEAVIKKPPLVVVDAALIYETGLNAELDAVVVVEATRENRVKRLRLRDGFSDEEIGMRIAAQMPLEDKVHQADVVVSNNGTLSELRERIRRLYEDVLRDQGGDVSPQGEEG